MQQTQRIKKLDGFREGKANVLVCTDVASRGIDIPTVDVVINIHCPKDVDTLVHRCGRTARMGKTGTSIIIADGDDRKRLGKYKKDIGFNRIKNITVPMKNLDPLRGDIEKLKIVEKAEFKSSTENRDLKWKQKVSGHIGIELSDDEKVGGEQDQKKKADLQSKKTNLKHSLSDKKLQQYVTPRKNVFLSIDEIKKLSDELNQARQQATEVRDHSSTIDQEISKPLKYRVKPARDPSNRKLKFQQRESSFISGPLGDRHMTKRKPSIKEKSRSQKKYKRR